MQEAEGRIGTGNRRGAGARRTAAQLELIRPCRGSFVVPASGSLCAFFAGARWR